MEKKKEVNKLPPYQKLLSKSSQTKKRTPFIWDRIEAEDKLYS